MKTIYIGIDPGKKGAIVSINEDSQACSIADLPLAGKDIDVVGLDALILSIKSGNPDCRFEVFIEKAQSMPKQGVSSSFNYGKAYGTIIGIIAGNGLRFTLVHPRTWKKVMMESMNKSDKDMARQRAIQLWPLSHEYFKFKVNEHRAEAALIAEYGRRLFNEGEK